MIHKILVVDDLKSMYSAIANTLTPRGCDVTYSSNGTDGIKTATESCFDLIILDIHLPDMNGLDICKHLKSLPQYKLRPILMLTSDPRNLERGLKAGASDYILKPFNEIEMIARIFTQLNLSKENLNTFNENSRLQANLNEERNRLIEAQNDLHNYFYQTSHKLRSPLCSMEGLLQLISIECPELSNKQCIKLFDDSLKKLSYVNQQVATIGDIKYHRLTIEQFNLERLITSFVKKNYSNSSIKITIDSTVYINTDYHLFTTALKPIIDNAVFFSQLKRQDNAVIFIKIIEESKQLKLIIKDNGPGINPNQLNKIFEMFYVGNEASDGNGLGLIISKIALNKLNYQLTIDSVENQFTSFYININDQVISSRSLELNNIKKYA